METFGERLRRLRTAAGMTPSALAHAVGVTEGAIRQMETGHTKSASFVVGLELAEVLAVEPWLLATGGERRKGGEEWRQSKAPDLEARVTKLEERLAAMEREPQRKPARRRAS